MKFELNKWQDGTFRLVHWDNISGDDINLEIRSRFVYEHKYDKDGNEIIEIIDLLSFLNNLKKRCNWEG